MCKLLKRVLLLHRQLVPALFDRLLEDHGPQLREAVPLQARSELCSKELQCCLRLVTIVEGKSIPVIKLVIVAIILLVLLLVLIQLIFKAQLATILLSIFSILLITGLIRFECELRLGTETFLGRLLIVSTLVGVEAGTVRCQSDSHDLACSRALVYHHTLLV